MIGEVPTGAAKLAGVIQSAAAGRGAVSTGTRRLSTRLANARVSRLVGGLATAGLIAVLVVVWRDVAPRASAGGEVRFYSVDGRTPGSDGAELPVFVMRDGRGAIRHGVARVLADQRLRIEFYESPLPGFAAATEPLLFEPTLTAMWVAASDDSRQELMSHLGGAQDEVARTIERIVGSDVFATDYRPVLRAILGDALGTAWADDKARVALDRLLAVGSRIAQHELQGKLTALLERRVETAIWTFLAENWVYLPATPFGVELDFAPVQAVIKDAFADPELRSLLAAFGGRMLEVDETRLLAERLTIGAVDVLLRDPRLPKVAARMFADPQLRQQVKPLADALMALAAAVPRHLGGLGAENDLNPLAAHVFKAMTLNAPVGFVMFVTPATRARIQQVDREAAVPLRLDQPSPVTDPVEPQ